MDNKKVSKILRVAICIAAICGLIICASCYRYIIIAFKNAYENLGAENFESIFLPFLHVGLRWLCAVPCFIILGIAWKSTYTIERDQFFCKQTAKDIFHCFILLFIASIV